MLIRSVMERRERTVKVLEICQLYALAHAEHIACCAKAVYHHPYVACIQGRHGGGCFSGLCGTVRLEGVLDVGPCSDDGGEHHEAEGEQTHAGYSPSEPEHFTVSNQNNGEVFKDCIDGDREELEGL